MRLAENLWPYFTDEDCEVLYECFGLSVEQLEEMNEELYQHEKEKLVDDRRGRTAPANPGR